MMTNIFAKVCDNCLLDKIEHLISFDDLQMSFVHGGGNDNAVFNVRSVIEYFVW